MNKVAVITAIYGGYEKTCKPYVQQTVGTDFICFTDDTNLKSDLWEIDTTPYHLIYRNPIDTGYYINSINKIPALKQYDNAHSFNVAKYYKQSWHMIPRLKNYDLVIWVDGSIELLSPIVSEYMSTLCSQYGIVSWHHDWRGGNLIWEVEASFLPRYHSRDYLGQKQPYQDVVRQYHSYIEEGFQDGFFRDKYPRKEGRGRGDHFGVWVTGFVAFDARSEAVKKFLNLWYLQTLKYTTQDQVGFVKAVWETFLVPYTLPDGILKGDHPHYETDAFKVHKHGE